MSGDGGEDAPQDDSLQSSPSSTQAGLYPRYAHAIAGAGGGLATVLALHPVDTLKTRLQSDAASRRIGALRVMRGIVLLEGPRALYRGSIPAMVGSVASWAFYMHWFHSVRGVISSRLAGAPPSAGTDFLAGTSAGLLTALGTNPIWVVKVRLQLQRGPAVHQGLAAAAGSTGTAYTGMLHGFRCILRDEGVTGLYKGLGPSLWLVSHGAIQFTLYEQFKTALVSLSSNSSSRPDEDGASSSGTSVRDSLLASTASKLVAAAATYPLQLVRTRMQERGAGGDRYGTFFAGFSRVLRIEGPRGFYRGFAANVARVLPQSAVTFVTYEQIMNLCAFLNAKYGSSESQRS
jgi:solute carrier family 25 (mitochondrial folate transporter), member 32